MSFRHELQQSLPPAAIEKIRSISGNDMCMDCGSAEPDWGDVLHGSLHCIRCAGRHRALGVSVSFCRSLTMDNWTEANLLNMLLGGNRQLKSFFTRQRVANSSVECLYASRPAAYYREQLSKQVDQLLQKRRQQRHIKNEKDLPPLPLPRRREKQEEETNHDENDDGEKEDVDKEEDSSFYAEEEEESPQKEEGQEEVKEEECCSRSLLLRGASAPAAMARPRRRKFRREIVDFDATIRDQELGASLTRALPPPGWSCPGKSMALVTKVRSTGAANILNIRVGDYVVAMNGRALHDYDEFVSLFPKTQRPTRLTVRRFQRVPVVEDEATEDDKASPPQLENSDDCSPRERGTFFSSQEEDEEDEDSVLKIDFGLSQEALGFSIEKDSFGRARVSRVAPGGRAACLGVKVDDVVVSLNNRDAFTYDVVVQTLPLLEKPIVAGLRREGRKQRFTTTTHHEPPVAKSANLFSARPPKPLGAQRSSSNNAAGHFGARLNGKEHFYQDDDESDDDIFASLPRAGTKKVLAPKLADKKEFDVVFDDGPLGMRIEERIGLVALTVVTHVDPKGQAKKKGVTVGCTVQGLNGEKYLSHAHTAATLRHARRPIAARLRHAD